MTLSIGLLSKIHDRCVEEGECWVWQGSTTDAGLPRLVRDSVRRLVWTHIKGEIKPGLLVSCTCNERLCVNPDHLVLKTKAQVLSDTARLPAARQKRIRSMSVAARSKGKLTEEIAEEIRQSGEKLTVLGERYGVHFSLISKVKRGDAWKNHASPFAGLGAR